MWSLPGGRLENEKIDQGIKRECLEELGLIVEIPNLSYERTTKFEFEGTMQYKLY